MANQTDTYNAESKFSGVMVAPEKLTIVGLDCPEDQCPDLADPDRINLPIDDLVPSIAAHGVRVAIAIRKYPNDSHVYVVTGRRRVRAAREANRQLADDCKILVPCIPEEKGRDVLASLVLENEHRVGDSPLAKARKAARMKERGHSDAAIATTFGVTSGALRVWWSLLDASPATQTAVEQGKIGATVGAEIGKLNPVQQAGALREAIAAGKGSAALENVRKVKNAAKNGEAVNSAPRRLSAKQIKELAEEICPFDDEKRERFGDPVLQETYTIAWCLLRAVTGEGVAALDRYPELANRFRAITDAVPASSAKTNNEPEVVA